MPESLSFAAFIVAEKAQVTTERRCTTLVLVPTGFFRGQKSPFLRGLENPEGMTEIVSRPTPLPLQGRSQFLPKMSGTTPTPCEYRVISASLRVITSWTRSNKNPEGYAKSRRWYVPLTANLLPLIFLFL